MDRDMQAMVEQLKKQVCQEAQGMSIINKLKKVSGKRVSLPLHGRAIDIVYYPAVKENAPLLIGFHGGGFLFGGCALDDEMWVAMAKELNVNIASIGYRKTPAYRYPCALEDAYDSAVYLKNHASEFGFDADHISVFGNSAGANLATSLCILAKEKGEISFDYQILNYPFLDCYTNPIDKGEGTFEAPILIVFNQLYCNMEETRLATVSPIYASKKQLEGLPKTILYLAENDNLRKEGQIYASHLRDAGIEVFEGIALGMPHAYFEYGFVEGNEYVSDDIKCLIENGSIAREARKCLAFIKEKYII